MTSLRTVSEKGQVTVPKHLRERLGIKAGDQLAFSEEHGLLVARKATGDDPVEAVLGVLRLDVSTDEAIRELRGDPELG
jgi:antitoxin PrlF